MIIKTCFSFLNNTELFYAFKCIQPKTIDIDKTMA